jgi:predicted aspartyl protease
MKAAILILLSAAALTGASGTVMTATRTAHLLILQEVYVNGDGPFRMMIDTGNASSLVRPSLAGRLGLRPSGWLVHATAAGDRRVPAALLDEVRVGNVIDKTVEVMIGDVHLPGVDGVLGQSWLVRHNYLLDYRNHRLVVDGEPPESGVRAALRSPDGRPAIEAEVNGRTQDLIIDSGAQVLVLFERSAPARQVLLLTNTDSIAAGNCAVRIAIGAEYHRKMPAVRVSASNPGHGLLPTASFGSVYVSNREGLVVLIP